MQGKRMVRVGILLVCLLALMVGAVSAQGISPAAAPAKHGWVRISKAFDRPTNTSISALAVYQGYLYAGTINRTMGASVWRWDGKTWTQVAGPGVAGAVISTVNNPAITDMVVFNNKLYVGTAWSSLGPSSWKYQVWSYDGNSWGTGPVLESGSPVHGYTNFEVNIDQANPNNSELYVGISGYQPGQGTPTMPAKVIKTTGNSGSWVTVVDGSSIDPNSYGITGLKLFNGYLFVSVANNNGAQVWKCDPQKTNACTMMNTPNTDMNSWDSGGFTIFGGKLYLGIRNAVTGGKLYRTDGTSWETITNNGFGDLQNIKIEGTIEYQGFLYAMVTNATPYEVPATGMEVWVSPDGSPGSWTLDRGGGFGSPYNTNSLWTSAQAVYNNQLYVGTSNKDTQNGGELWMTTSNLIYIPVVRR